MQTLSIGITVFAMGVSLVVTSLFIWRRRYSENREYDAKLREMQQMIADLRGMQPTELTAKKSKIEQAERVMHELIAH